MFRPILFFLVTYIRNQGYDICNLCNRPVKEQSGTANYKIWFLYHPDDGRGDRWCFIWAQVLWLFQCIIGIPHAGRIYQNKKSKALPSKGWLLAFHPDLISQTSLGEHIKDYSFFFYNPEEALHLSQREKAKAVECICNIEEELRHAIDCHSQILISRYIELLLDHCNRFYEIFIDIFSTFKF